MLSTIVEYMNELKEVVYPVIENDSGDSEDKEVADGDDDEEDEDDDDDDEDEEEEATDPYDQLRKECEQTEEGQRLKHHYLECAERVEKQKEDPNYEELDHKEDCVEEFFHLQHYLDSCASPKLFSKLK